VQRPEVIFYVLASSSQLERQDFACKLIEKIYRTGKFCYVLTDNAEQAAEMNSSLWTFRAGSFVPHQLFLDHLPSHPNTILIGEKQAPEHWQKVIVNLSNYFPNTHAPTESILEILDNSETSKQAGRQRYRHYLEAGLQITTHKNESGVWIESRTH